MAAQHRGDRVWLDVAYSDKEQAKALGGRWDPVERRWYAGPRAHPDLLARWAARPELPITLPGEDRSFGTGLYIDLIPSTAWFTNIRSAISGADWERLRRLLYRRADQRCELCGRGANPQQRRYLEAHERFAYHEDSGTQVLKRLLLVCSDCHEVTHYGLAELRGRGPAAFAHLRAITRMTETDATAHVEVAFARWQQRSTRTWALDLSPLTQAGITVTPPPAPATRARVAEQQLRHRTTTGTTPATTPAAIGSTPAITRGTAGGTAWAVVPAERPDSRPSTSAAADPEIAIRARPPGPPGSCDCSDHDPDPLPQLTRPATPPAPPDQQDAPEPAPGGGTPPWWRRW